MMPLSALLIFVERYQNLQNLPQNISCHYMFLSWEGDKNVWIPNDLGTMLTCSRSQPMCTGLVMFGMDAKKVVQAEFAHCQNNTSIRLGCKNSSSQILGCPIAGAVIADL